MPGAGGRTSNRLAPAPAGPVSLEHAAPTRLSGGGSLSQSFLPCGSEDLCYHGTSPCSPCFCGCSSSDPCIFLSQTGAKIRYQMNAAAEATVKAQGEVARDLTSSAPASALSLVGWWGSTFPRGAWEVETFAEHIGIPRRRDSQEGGRWRGTPHEGDSLTRL
ncbi:hypothetical protein CLIM01_11883 [Colletotrichum limetticola]|uniref:Uncharacterized protein n=1 Tax=Colletotrichum limetticola TaxID=1209924 RepID=A0ABQ9PFA2_9PEZI|nr:hypothetical protein CLIM01_11883 [Colletotrichum limetticola]